MFVISEGPATKKPKQGGNGVWGLVIIVNTIFTFASLSFYLAFTHTREYA